MHSGENPLQMITTKRAHAQFWTFPSRSDKQKFVRPQTTLYHKKDRN